MAPSSADLAWHLARTVDFWSWSGWAGVSAVAQLVALGTFVIAGWQYIVARRQFPAVVFSWNIIGTATEGTNTYHVLEVHNLGRAPAVIMMIHLFDARAELQPEYRAPAVLGPGGSFQLLVSAERLEDAWVRVMWQTVSNRYRVHVMWEPLLRGGKRDKQYKQDSDARQRRGLRTRVRDWRDGVKVGPGGAARATVKLHAGSDRAKRALYPPEGVGLAYSAQADSDDIDDLRYVPRTDTASTS